MNKLLIVGNGFDLNIGLQTSYQNFLESAEFRSLLSGVIIESDNSLVNFINKQNSKNDWVDVENLLKKFANGYQFAIKEEVRINELYKFKREFVAVKEKLAEYLAAEQKKFKREKICQGLTILQNGSLFRNTADHAPHSEIVTFNFTNCLEEYHKGQNARRYGIHHIHGSLEQGNIVFGVDDGSVPTEFAFLNKSDHACFGETNLVAKFRDSERIDFFGCSLGETDDTHFEPAFNLLNQQGNFNKTLNFYIFGKQGYESLRTNLLRHTKNKLGNLKNNHKIHFYDLKDDVEITQDWLNNLGTKPN
jgi:Bacteriophage abortive infection AbiH